MKIQSQAAARSLSASHKVRKPTKPRRVQSKGPYDANGDQGKLTGSLADLLPIAERLHIHTLEDWYKVPKAHLKQVGGSHLLKNYETVEELVTALYPQHLWESTKFAPPTGKTFGPQIFLQRIIRTLFPEPAVILSNVRSLPILGNNANLEVDIYLPDLKLGFEYQEAHHYFNTRYGSSTLQEYQNRDKQKQEQAQQLGVTLIAIPFWWNWQIEELITTIRNRRPDLLLTIPSLSLSAPTTITPPPSSLSLPLSPTPPSSSLPLSPTSSFLSLSPSSTPSTHTLSHAHPPPPPHTHPPPLGVSGISETPPKNIVDQYDFEIPELGTPMLALDAPRSSGTFDPISWWMFEKYDGIRAVWSGSTLYTRWGTPLNIPFCILDSLPSSSWLDSEIWFGRSHGARSKALSVSSSKRVLHKLDWEEMKLMIFDAPSPSLRHLPYQQRYLFLSDSLGENHPFASLASYFICENRDSVEAFYFQVRSKNGEGIILRNADAPYVNGYSRFIYKHKGFNDAEAQVVRKVSPSRYLCRVHKGQLRHHATDMPSPSPPLSSPSPPLSSSSPSLSPISSSSLQSSSSPFSSSPSPPLSPPSMALSSPSPSPIFQPPPHTKKENTKNGNEKFLELEVPVDPGIEVQQNVPFYQPSRAPKIEQSTKKESELNTKNRNEDFLELEMTVDPKMEGQQDIPVGKFVSFKYLSESKPSGSPPINPIIYVVRDDILSWDQLMHAKNSPSVHTRIWKPKTANNWMEVSNHRKFFDKFAADNNFDPLVASNWYQQKRKVIMKMASGLLSKYGDSLVTALMNVYPEIGLQPHLFATKQQKYWTNKDNRRKFFDSYAESRSFSPLVPKNWYSIDTVAILQEKGGAVVLRYYKGSVINALLDLYPSIGLDPHLFKSVTANHWVSKENRKAFFDRFAASLNLDPCDPNTWYGITRDQIMKAKSGRGVLWYYKYSYVTAINNLYPNIGLDSAKFSVPPRKYWDEASNRKKFFDSFANERKFSPLDPNAWYEVDKHEILNTKSGKLVLSYYKGSFAHAIASVYPSIGLDISQMQTIPRNYWTERENRINFFESVAKKRGLDPLLASSWYTLHRSDIIATKGGSGVLNHYKGSMILALKDAFPDISFTPHLIN